MDDRDLKADSYVSRHLELGQSTLTDQLKRELGDLAKPVREVDFSQPGEVTLKKGAIEWKFYHEDLDVETMLALADIAKFGYMPFGIRLIKSFSMVNTKSGARMELSDILSRDVILAFDSRPSSEPMTDAASVGTNHIILSNPLTVPKSVFVLLHEAGHFNDFKARVYGKIFDDTQDSFPISNSEAAELLRRERNASAFALTKIRPFIDDDGPFTESTLRYFVHHESLHSHSKSIADKLTRK